MRIYTDESCTRADQGPYMLIGGIVCDAETAREIRKAIQILKINNGLNNDFEFHFSQIKPNQVQIYKNLCEIFLEFYNQKCSYKRGIDNIRTYRRVCFEGIIITHDKIDHYKFNQGDAELGFFRFYYTFLAHVLRKHYFSEDQFHITIDAITTKNPKMVPNLHQRLKDSCLPEVSDPMKTIHRQNSKAELLLQMADVILGSVSFAWNKLPTESSRNIDAKREVVQYLENKLGIPLSNPTYFAKSFNIWELDMK
ncbi:DUF3800 domain-containing protein [Richelia sinica]|uniref:DUF3800 domain-containing protein n=1 Tax=Richelia sinica TaxID=1357545 RepID=UPI0016864995|nr:DUF3800 domain-containing protein [Richelia sinica]MBD2667251.1 DUF3800 domain-containing protein [Richelia sinica FACHB-800]